MSRRRLQIVCSSDEEDEEQVLAPPPPPPQQQEQELDDIIIDDMETEFQTVTLNSANPTPNSSNSFATANIFGNGRQVHEPIPIDISDEGDNSDSPINSNFDNLNSGSYFEVSQSPVNGVLERLGLRLRRDWLDSCLHELQSSRLGFQRMDDSTKAKLCFEQFLCSDMNNCGAGVLPPNVHELHLVDLKGPFVLQVDEIVNISCPLRGRYQNAGSGIKRCLKLSMTDGVQRVFGMEYRPIKDLEALAPAGLKVVVCNVNVRHGLLILVPEVLEVLGGVVKELEAARQMLVNEINKPPRGKRNKTGVVPPLATRATLAAWPQHSDVVPEYVGQERRANTTPVQASEQVSSGTAVRQSSANAVHRNNIDANPSVAPPLHEHGQLPGITNVPRIIPPRFSVQGTEYNSPSNDNRISEMGVPISSSHVNRVHVELSTLSPVQPLEKVTTQQQIDEPMAEVSTSSMVTEQVATPVVPANHTPGDITSPLERDTELKTSSAVGRDDEEMSIIDELDYRFILSRDDEIPFTYLASLSAKCVGLEDEAPSVRGKVKCFLTGVKGFQYKKRTAYELRVYIDDGSLISEILIDHQVVQNGIGHSPQDVTSALASSDTKRVSEMKEILKQFQIFLINFEGTMVVEMNKASPVPVAIEMNQGCSPTDAWQLLHRLKSFDPASSRLNPIELSP